MMFEQGQANPAIQPVLAPLRHSDLKPSDIDRRRPAARRQERLPLHRLAEHAVAQQKIEWRPPARHVTPSHDEMEALPGRYPHNERKIHSMYDDHRSSTRTDGPALGGRRRTPRNLSAMPSAFGDQAQNPTAKRAVQFRNGPWMPGRWSKPRLQLEFRPPSASRLTPNTPPEPASGASGKAAQASAPV